jgi:diaminohydroxyphosphoribosylaminopyrimidine deaminase/5-amino-6-(5-phosphoribosylamino)uracil reductase
MEDREYMSMALALAQKGQGFTAPNPMVGAVIVKDGRIIGKGWHEKYGQPHAERNALSSCTESPRGATMYVTLEPCCHHGKQPPCTDAILEAGIRRVVVGSSDPNPLVGGKGIQILRANGVEITENVLRASCDQVNEVFFHYIRTGRPFVVLKYAMTLDGKIAAYTGESKWITGEEARAHVHQQRHRYTAIMAGVGTVLADDPLLTCRMPGGKNPIRILCDTNLRTPLTARVVTTARDVPTLLATCCTDRAKQQAYEAAGCRVLQTAERDGHVDIPGLMEQLGKEGIDSILLEGGGTLNWAALEGGAVQKVLAYIAPKLLGGETAKTPVEGLGAPDPDHGVRLKNSKITPLGEDFLVESEVEPVCSQELWKKSEQ